MPEPISAILALAIILFSLFEVLAHAAPECRDHVCVNSSGIATAHSSKRLIIYKV